MTQQFLDYQTFIKQQYSNPQCGYTLVEGMNFISFNFLYIYIFFELDKQKGTDVTIDEHFRKSLGDNYDKFTGGFLTPEDSSSNSSPTERTPG
jgi:hypothetical protein